MAAFLDRMTGSKLLWLDYSAYAGTLLAGGRIPWLDVAACIGWQRKAQGLLKSDVVPVPVALLIADWLATHSELARAMGEKKRVLFPLKTLLADSLLRGHLLDLLQGLRSSFGKTLLALVLPAPRRWIAIACEQAGASADNGDIGGDEIDSASVYVADFLRAFGQSGIDSLLLEEAADVSLTSSGLELYQPMINVAAHYRWDFGIHLKAGANGLDTSAGLGFVIAPSVVETVATGIEIPTAFWADAPVPDCPANGFRFAEVPADASPEKVLERLGVLRG
jgi:hypothetical protein